MIRLEPISYKEPELLAMARERNDSLASLRTSDETPESISHQKKWLESMTSSEKYYFIYNTEPNPGMHPFVGYCGLDKISIVNKTAEISLLICEFERSKGYGSEAVRLLLDKAFGMLQLNLVYGEVYHSTKTPEFWLKQGFVSEGVLRYRKWWNGWYHNSTVFSMTADEWLLKKESMRA